MRLFFFFSLFHRSLYIINDHLLLQSSWYMVTWMYFLLYDVCVQEKVSAGKSEGSAQSKKVENLRGCDLLQEVSVTIRRFKKTTIPKERWNCFLGCLNDSRCFFCNVLSWKILLLRSSNMYKSHDASLKKMDRRDSIFRRNKKSNLFSENSIYKTTPIIKPPSHHPVIILYVHSYLCQVLFKYRPLKCLPHTSRTVKEKERLETTHLRVNAVFEMLYALKPVNIWKQLRKEKSWKYIPHEKR